ncbi:polyprenyl diphosphate synthase [Nanoarchaeota archaeon]
MIQHLGVVLDGNRRFAKRLMKKPWKGHEWGAGKVRKLIDWCYDLGMQELTMYAFSMQNFNRPAEEFKYLMDLFKKEFDRLNQPDNIKELMDKGIRVRVIGRINMFASEIQECMELIMDKTKDNTKFFVNFAMAYGGREEILDAVEALATKIREGSIQEITKEVFEDHLYIKSEPELIIRTGGDRRTSNFLVWQSYYSEWLFLDKFWPEFDRTDLISAVDNFENRDRRFGR